MENDDQAQLMQLRQRLVSQARRVDSELADTSTLPRQSFDIEDPMLEAALTDSAMQFFLAHMTGLHSSGNSKTAAEAPEPQRRETIETAELEATMERLRRMTDVPTPDLMAGLASERLWILIDLATQGTGLARQQATLELREFCQEPASATMDDDLLTALARQLEREGGGSPLNQVLLRTVRDRLEHLGAEGAEPADD